MNNKIAVPLCTSSEYLGFFNPFKTQNGDILTVPLLIFADNVWTIFAPIGQDRRNMFT